MSLGHGQSSKKSRKSSVWQIFDLLAKFISYHLIFFQQVFLGKAIRFQLHFVKFMVLLHKMLFSFLFSPFSQFQNSLAIFIRYFLFSFLLKASLNFALYNGIILNNFGFGIGCLYPNTQKKNGAALEPKLEHHI